MVKSPFRYPGGKGRSNVASWILSHKPDTVREYREPFVGGGGVFFAMPRCEREWLNDMHAGLVSVYKALRDWPDRFISMCRMVPPEAPGEPAIIKPKGSTPYNARLGKVFNMVLKSPELPSAFRYYFINRCGYAGRVNYALPSRLYYSNPKGWNIVATDALTKASERLQQVKLTCRDFDRCLAAKGEDVWIYCDPPYWKDTEHDKGSKLYEHGFTPADHARLAKAVKKCPHKVAVSYHDDPRVRRAYKGLRIASCSWKYCGSSQTYKSDGLELLIMNY